MSGRNRLPFCFFSFLSLRNGLNWPILGFLLSFSNSSPASLLLAVLEVYVLSTDGQVQDFKFPQIGKSGISIQLSANTVKLNSRNGELKKQR